MAQDDLELVRSLFDAFSARDVERIVALTDPDVEIVSLRSALEGVFRGHDGVRRWARGLLDTAENSWVEPDELRSANGRVLVIGRQGGRGNESGVPFEGPLAIVVEVRNGLLLRSQAYASADEAREAVGLGR